MVGVGGSSPLERTTLIFYPVAQTPFFLIYIANPYRFLIGFRILSDYTVPRCSLERFQRSRAYCDNSDYLRNNNVVVI